MRYLFCLPLLAACGAPFPDTGGCTGGVITEDLRDCYCLQDEQAAAERVVQDLGLSVPDGVRIWVHASDEKFATSDGDYAWGRTLDADNVELNRWAQSWAHELLHVHELRAGVPNAVTAEHAGWVDRGWMKAGDTFESAAPHCD